MFPSYEHGAEQQFYPTHWLLRAVKHVKDCRQLSDLSWQWSCSCCNVIQRPSIMSPGVAPSILLAGFAAENFGNASWSVYEAEGLPSGSTKPTQFLAIVLHVAIPSS